MNRHANKQANKHKVTKRACCVALLGLPLQQDRTKVMRWEEAEAEEEKEEEEEEEKELDMDKMVEQGKIGVAPLL